MSDAKITTNFFHNNVKTLEEFKQVEQKLFSYEFNQPIKLSVFCEENNTIYFYKTQKVKGHLLMITDGEYVKE